MSARAIARAHHRQTERRARRLSRKARAGAGIAAAIGATALGAGAANAANFPVTNTADDGEGSLREAVTDANNTPGADTITFAPNVTGTIALETGALGIFEPLEIQGPGADTLTVDGTGNDGIFDIDGSFGGSGNRMPVTISGLTLTGGDQSEGGAIYGQYTDFSLESSVVSDNTANTGGGLYLDSAVVSISDSVVTGNETTSGGGAGIYVDGDNDSASPAGDTVRIADSVFSDNTANYAGGAIYIDNSTAGAALIVRSTIVGNSTLDGNGGGVKFYGHRGTSTIRQSTVSGNTADDSGGGIYFDSAYTEPSDFLVENSTVSGNSAAYGAGVYISDDGGGEDVPIGLVNSTVASNTATNEGGGVMLDATPDAALSSTIVADNVSATPAGADLAQTGGATGAFDVGFSLVESSAGATVNATGPNVLGADPQLGPLTDNGGPTETMLPAESSPAIDQGTPNGLTFDQRGEARTSGAGTDIGSVELQPDPPPVDKPPKITGMRVVPNKFSADEKPTPLGPNRAKKGAAIKLKLSEDARVTFRVKNAKAKPAPNSPKLPRAFRRNLDEGKNTVDFTGTLGKRAPFKPGKYRVVARAKDAAGQKSKKVSAVFRIVR